jgi:hypothetical protein
VPADTSGTTSIGAATAAVPLAVAQNGSLTFAANAGQQVTVRLTANAFGWVTVRLLRPDGSQLTSVKDVFVEFQSVDTDTAHGGNLYDCGGSE